MDTKAAFEKWCSEKGYSTEQFHYGNWAGQYKLESVRNKWEGWKESRAAIEIELPTEKTYRRDTSPILRAQSCGYNDAVADCGSTITSHGIRIKGKTE